MAACRFLTLLAVLASAGVAHAQVAAVRLACDGDSQGAEVAVNGKVVGDCPIDVQVQPGNVRVTALKNVDAQQERTFATEFRVGPGTAKRVQVELGAPQLNAQAQRQAEAAQERAWATAQAAKTRGAIKTFLTSYPNGRFTAEASRQLDAIPRPARPKLPFELSEAVWAAIEDSEAFAATPAMHTGRSSLEKYYAAGTFAGTHRKRAEVKLLAPGHALIVRRVQFPAGDHDTDSYVTLGGLLQLGSVESGTGVYAANAGQRVVTRVNKLEGSLFPMAMGARMRMHTTESFPRLGSAEVIKTCKVVQGPLPASTLSARLSGNAWRVGCDVTYQFSVGPTESGSYFHYLEDYGLFTDSIGAASVAFPAPGSEEVSALGTAKVIQFDFAID